METSPHPNPPHQGEGLLAGATHGLNAPPGTAEATGLSKPSFDTEDTPNTQSSTRMPLRTDLHGEAGMNGWTLPLATMHKLLPSWPELTRLSCQMFESVRRQRSM